MEITVSFDSADSERLQQALGRGLDGEHVAQIVMRAGAVELLAQATGRTVPNTMADLRAFRIYCLIQQGLELNDAEGVIAGLFKVPPATAKRLVNTAVARYSIELETDVSRAIATLLDEARWEAESLRWMVRIPSVFVRERVLDALHGLDLPDPVSAQRGPLWSFVDETFQALRESFGLDSKPKPAE